MFYSDCHRRPLTLIYAPPARAILLIILWKLMEGSLPKVLVPHTPVIVDAVTGEQGVRCYPLWLERKNQHS